jgi:Fe-S oxidoreductase
MAEAAGADTLVTACPWCVQNFRDCQGGRERVRVMDLLEVLDSALATSGAGAERGSSRRR